jgi:hypothetical protein
MQASLYIHPDHEPLQFAWTALERADCHPHGEPHDFRARCPKCQSTNATALHVSIGGDRSAAMHCFRCGANGVEVMRALGADGRHLYPPGHHKAPRLHLPQARRPDFDGAARTLANALLAVERLDGYWYAELRTDCGRCGAPHAILQATSASDSVVYLCPGDDYADAMGFGACTLEHCQQGLAGRLAREDAV